MSPTPQPATTRASHRGSDHAALLALLAVVDDLTGHGAWAATGAPAGGWWSWTASLVEQSGSAQRLLAGEIDRLHPADRTRVAELIRTATSDHHARAAAVLGGLPAGVRLTSILDDGYPANLRAVFDRPPFLTVRGRLDPDQQRVVAVVGAEPASAQDLAGAGALAAKLTREAVTVVSGLGSSVDHAAVTGALDAGGRPLVVADGGIAQPLADPDLVERVLAAGGGLVAATWPHVTAAATPAERWQPVVSGLGLGMVVVAGDAGSRARALARVCLEHAEHLFLPKHLTLREPWIRHYADHPGATVIDGADDVREVVAAMTELLATPALE
jgi:DNA processing protein